MYQLIGTKSVKRLADGACIPFANGNIDYEGYKLWLEEGNTPEPEFTEAEITQQKLEAKIAEAKAYLSATDFKMTVDYYSTLTEAEQLELTAKRKEAREFIRANEGVL